MRGEHRFFLPGQFQRVELLDDLFRGRALIKCADHQVKRDTRASHAIDTSRVSRQRNRVHDSSQTLILPGNQASSKRSGPKPAPALKSDNLA